MYFNWILMQKTKMDKFYLEKKQAFHNESCYDKPQMRSKDLCRTDQYSRALNI